MTTIAYRDGVMASDSGCWIGGAHHAWTRKVARGPDGTLYGVAGKAGMCVAFIDWVEGGAAGERPDATEKDEENSAYIVLVARPSGEIELLTAFGTEKYPGASYMAIGAACEVAFGALFMGATAEQAIEAAKEHGSGASGRVQVVRVS